MNKQGENLIWRPTPVRTVYQLDRAVKELEKQRNNIEDPLVKALQREIAALEQRIYTLENPPVQESPIPDKQWDDDLPIDWRDKEEHWKGFRRLPTADDSARTVLLSPYGRI
jgi:hypothetical protein